MWVTFLRTPGIRRARARRTIQSQGSSIAAGEGNSINHGHAEHVWLILDKDHRLTLPYDDSEFALARAIADVTGREAFTFTARSEPGEYTIVCSIPEHAQKGMIGTLVVKQGSVIGDRRSGHRASTAHP